MMVEECVLCVVGMLWDGTGITFLNECNECGGGIYVVLEGSLRCELCLVGCVDNCMGCVECCECEVGVY